MTAGTVYAIRSREGICLYVGSTLNVRRRWATHLQHLRGGRHHSRALQRFWNKHGSKALRFEVIYEAEPGMLRAEEVRAISELRPLFNCLRSDMPQGPMRHAPESVDKMRASHAGRYHSPEAYKKSIATRRAAFPDGIIRLTPEHIANARAGFMKAGRKVSESSRELMRIAKAGKPLTPGHAAKIANALKGRMFTSAHREKLRHVALRRWHTSPPDQLTLL